MLRKIAIGAIFPAVSLVVGGLVFVWRVGAWNIVFPFSQHDVTAPNLPADLQPQLYWSLVKQTDFAIKKVSQADLPLGMFATENGAIFNQPDLQRFDGVVFLNATGDMLSDQQENAF